ncbi:MAG: DUF1214 domain-containing protein [Acidiferrobacterales bacterium]
MFNQRAYRALILSLALSVLFAFVGCGQGPETASQTTGKAVADQAGAQLELTDEQVRNIVRQAYRFVAMYNVNNKMAFDSKNPMSTGGLNRFKANTKLLDHTMKAIARPNNDTLYVSALIDLSHEPVIIESPAFDSMYVSMMITGYDHYVNIPMSTRQGDFAAPSRLLIYSARTPGYAGEAVEGVDKIFETTGDFVSVVYRVMPHASEPERMQRNLEEMQSIRAVPLSEFLPGSVAATGGDIDFPDFGRTDYDVFGNNFLEVMQFVFNHTTFDPDDEIDQNVLAAMEPLGVVPGTEFDPGNVAQIDGVRFRAAAESVFEEEMAKTSDPVFAARIGTNLFKPKGQMTEEVLLYQSLSGPIGQPASEAVYPSLTTTEGAPMNAMNDYVVRMTTDQMPPATAFWSLTLYDTANGFFIPNDRKKYSVGENGGMQLDDEGGIAVYVSEEQPEGVPPDNWLPLVRGDYAIDLVMRVYAPDLEEYATWTPPKAEVVD